MSCGMEPIKEDRGSCMAFPHPTCISPLSELFYIEHRSYFILSCLVLDIEGATSWYVITMSWPNVPCAKLPP